MTTTSNNITDAFKTWIYRLYVPQKKKEKLKKIAVKVFPASYHYFTDLNSVTSNRSSPVDESHSTNIHEAVCTGDYS